MSKSSLPEEAKVYYKGEWIPVSEVTVKKVRRARMKEAREELALKIVKYILESPRNCVRRSKLIELSRQVAEKMGLKRLGYRFLITEGIIGRPIGSKLYYLTEKAREKYPELFK